MNLLSKKILFTGIFLTGLFVIATAQPRTAGQLIERLNQLKKNSNYLSDTAYANTLNDLGFIYADNYPDSAIAMIRGHAAHCRSIGFGEGETNAYSILGNAYQTKGDFKTATSYYDQAYDLANKIKFQSQLPGIINNIGLVYLNQGNYTSALEKFYEGLKAAEAINNKLLIGTILNNIATIHFFQNKMTEAERDYQEVLAIAKEMSDTVGVIMAYNNISEVNLEQNNAGKALKNLTIGYQLAQDTHNPEMLVASTKNLGNVYYDLDNLPKAISYFETAITLARQQGNMMSTSKALIGLAKAQNKVDLQKEALANGLEAVRLSEEMGQTQLLRDASEIVANIYQKQGDDKLALQYYQVFKASSDSINNSESQRVAATFKAEYEFSKKELEFKRKEQQQRWVILSAFGALLAVAIIAWVINRNRKRVNQVNIDLHQKNHLIAAAKLKAEEALSQLKAVQSQLIQSEKMASLGELTAGIAHEIQNPLNFINNFSEVNHELLEEMKVEFEKGNMEEVQAILDDLEINEDRINFHGKRADAIVKGMLQHSSGGSGVKQPVDLNALADEFLRLSYHGLRGKDKSFNAAMQTDFDSAIGKVDIISQDIGRVLLNVYNNAFYAVNEKSRLNPNGYAPMVTVTTKRANDQVSIHVKDNGIGMPEKVANKVFQPFFTTKPPGQGTGLGLSLSYDIVTKGHGGQLNVITKEGEGSEFVILLPV